MKKLLLYFDPGATRIFVNKVGENGEKKVGLSSPYNFVSTSEIVARVIEIESESQISTRLDPGATFYKVIDFQQLKAREGIIFDSKAQAFKAVNYGFVVLVGGILKLFPVMSITKDRLQVFYNIYPTRYGKLPSAQEIQDVLHENKILTGIGQKKLEELLASIDPEKPKLSRILVAAGKAPVNAREETFKPIVNYEKKAGEIRSDGRIDFKEVGSVIQVFKGQEILERIPEVLPEEGMDVYGNTIPPGVEQVEGFRRGDNIVQSGTDSNIFLSAIDGVLKVVQKKISVLKTVVINGDVDYGTGNIEFNGSVEVTGSVLPGFVIRAKGDVTVKMSVEDAIIEAEGDVKIGMGVVGKESVKIICSGTFHTKYLQNATVEAGGEVTVEDSIINSNVFSNKSVNVTGKTGKIIGGTTTALYEVVVKTAGAVNETQTVLNVGRNLFIEKELEGIRHDIARWRDEVTEVIRKLKVNFGEGIFEDPKGFISILPPVKKKGCLLLLNELNQGNKILKELTDRSREVAEKLKLEREPVIIAYDRVYPGTVLNIGKRVRKIERDYMNAKFYEDKDSKEIKFTTAV